MEHKKTQEMSIEEILKSIKGVIENHEAKPEDSEEDILELTNEVTEPIIIEPRPNSTATSDANPNKDKPADKLSGTNKKPLVSDKPAEKTSRIFQQFAKTAEEIGKSGVKANPLEALFI